VVIDTGCFTLPTPPGVAKVGGFHGVLSDDEVRQFVVASLAGCDVDGRSVCVIVPDATRSCPLPLLIDAVHQSLAGRASTVTVLIALGTHAEMSEPQLAAHLGYPVGGLAARYPGMTVINHEWWVPDTCVSVGAISADRVLALSEGRLHQSIDVTVNRAVIDHDVAIVVGPVFPHEVVGFSGGNKYFVPGVAGPDVIDFSHWLGALISSAEIIGTPGITPVRALIDEAAALLPCERFALCLVVQSGTGEVHAATFGPPETAWAECAAVSALTHVEYLDAPVQRVVSVIPTKYHDMWTGAKGFYKVEPVVADGGQVILYAPHITEVSVMHPSILDIGYHCRDYFLGQWDEFAHRHWGELAHSTHLRGAGTWSTEHGEQCRVTVTLATGIPEHVVRSINLDYLDPSTLDLEALAAEPGTLFLPHAGEVLYRLR
jgi:nickel-dependent lactate racemase